MVMDVRVRQIESVKHMLNLNSSKSENSWKILVFDEYGRDIIAPLLTVKELRECGVTLNLLISEKREPIPDVPVVYFVMPTKNNIDLISSDCKNQMYDKFYINFITAVSRQLLEDLAQLNIESDSVYRIEKIFDQYLSFCMLEQNLFTISAYDSEICSYYALNRPDAKDVDIEKCINTITDSIFSLFVTLRELPVIRCPKGNAAEIVAENLEKKMRDARRDPKSGYKYSCDCVLIIHQRYLLGMSSVTNCFCCCIDLENVNVHEIEGLFFVQKYIGFEYLAAC